MYIHFNSRNKKSSSINKKIFFSIFVFKNKKTNKNKGCYYSYQESYL